jgi:hypothetical protein
MIKSKKRKSKRKEYKLNSNPMSLYEKEMYIILMGMYVNKLNKEETIYSIHTKFEKTLQTLEDERYITMIRTPDRIRVRLKVEQKGIDYINSYIDMYNSIERTYDDTPGPWDSIGE